MNKKNLIRKIPILISVILLLFITACTKDKTDPDYAGTIAGTYTGSVTVVGTGTVPGKSTLTRVNNTKVDLIIEIGTDDIPLNGIRVSNDDDDVYELEYTDASGSFDGKVNGNTLTWTLIAGSITETFSGTK